MANYNLFDAASLAMIPVGSKEGKVYSIKPEPVYGSEEVTNGTFNNDLNGWTINNANAANTVEWSEGQAHLKRTASTATELLQLTLVVGKKYYVNFDVNIIGDSVGGALEYNGSTRFIFNQGVNSFKFTASATKFSFICLSNSTEYYIDNISVKEVLTSSGDFTFSRGSNLAATRVGADGLIEKGRENLLLQSNTFDTWLTTTGTSVTSGQIGYDGSSDAFLLNDSGTNGSYAIFKTFSNTGVQTFSLYAKQASTSQIEFDFLNGGGGYLRVELTNGSVLQASGSVISHNTEDAGNGWWRMSFSVNHSTAPVYVRIGCNGAGSVYIQDAQIELGLAATEYIESGATKGTAGILERTPRFDYSNGASCPSLLLEPSRTNLETNYNYPDGNGVKSNVAVNTNATTSPDGYINANGIADDSTSGRHYTYNASSASSASGTTIIHSIYAKANTHSWFQITSGGSTNDQWAMFNVTTGIVGNTSASTVATIESAGNGWYRCSITCATTASSAGLANIIALTNNTNASARLPSYVGTGAGIYIYAIQTEEGNYPTSIIPTYGTSVTRAADVCGGAGDANTFNSTEGVLYAEMAALDNTQSASQYITISDGTYNNRLSILYSNGATNSIRAFLRVGGASQVDFSASIGNQKSFNKIAFKYKQNDFSLWVNGIEVATDTSGSTVSSDTLDELSFSEIGTSAGLFNGKVKQVLTFNTALLDTELAALTLRYENYQEWVTGERLTWESPSCTNNNITELKNL